MGFLVRKITKSKWFNVNDIQNEILDPDDISADALTSCLRTSKNTLSLWRVDDIENEDELNTIVLALVANSKSERLSTVDILYFEYDENLFDEKGINFEISDGDTTIKSCVDKHIDIVKLNLKTISIVVKLFCEFLNKSQSKRFSAKTIEKLLKKHLENNPNDKEGLTQELLDKLGLSPLE